MISKLINLDDLVLDRENPRFSYFNFDSEEQIIEHMEEYENLKELSNSISQNGYNSLGERLIVLATESEKYIVLEGNRRVATLKLLRNQGNTIVPQSVSCDVVSNRKEAELKISIKHISGIKSWSASEKKAYYHKKFQHLKSIGKTTKASLKELQETSSESLSTIRKDIVTYNFLKQVYEQFEEKDKYPLPFLPTDIVSGRIYNYFNVKLKLSFDEDLNMSVLKDNEERYKKILSRIAYYVWTSKQIDTRNTNKNKDFDQLIENKLIDLNELISDFLQAQKALTKVEEFSVDTEDSMDDYEEEILVEGSAEQQDIVRLIVIDEFVNIDKLPYELKKNVKLTINGIDSADPIEFFSRDPGDLYLTNNSIKSPTKNGIYQVSAKYGEFEKQFQVNVAVPTDLPALTFNNTDWFINQIRVLQGKKNCRKVIALLDYFKDVQLINDIDRIQSGMSLRALIEYSTKLYIEKVDPPASDNNLPGDYAKAVHRIGEYKQWRREEKRIYLSVEKSITSLNGHIHSPTKLLTDNLIMETLNNAQDVLEEMYQVL